MPRKKRVPKRRVPMDFTAIDGPERLRWAIGGPLIAGNFEPVHRVDGEERADWHPTVWASWAEWADVYERCREQYLATRAERPHLGVPDSEPIYAAIRAGEDPHEVIAALWRERHANDPRDLLYAAAREGR